MNNLDRAKLLERQWDNKKCGLGRQNWIKVCALELKEKVEKGCGNKAINYMSTISKCGYIETNGMKGSCKDCQETLKILTEILGEKE